MHGEENEIQRLGHTVMYLLRQCGSIRYERDFTYEGDKYKIRINNPRMFTGKEIGNIWHYNYGEGAGVVGANKFVMKDRTGFFVGTEFIGRCGVMIGPLISITFPTTQISS